jgi:hypothetical protein
MTCEAKLRKDVIGTDLEVEVLENCATALNVATATVKTIKVVKPDLTSFERAAAFTTDGTDGLIYITTEAGDLSLEGTYYIQAYLELPSGWQGKTDIGEFEVEDNL